MAQIIWQRHKARGPREQEYGDYDYCDESYYDRKGGQGSLAAFPLDISENLLLA
jgi:hypothetical protein